MKKLLLYSCLLLPYVAIGMDRKPTITISDCPTDSNKLNIDISENLTIIASSERLGISHLVPETIGECKIENITVINKVPLKDITKTSTDRYGTFSDSEMYIKLAKYFIRRDKINSSVESTMIFQKINNISYNLPARHICSGHGFQLHPGICLLHIYHESLEDEIRPSADRK